ncbi:hypothetical protein VPNG_03063 [Cytospora leucostoma]|uniref:Alpha/beta hydrolase fold-3 domain-containing protein n=1 Tax=Cytospora leucostoma TaxID=1230097 RepID=A0A423XGC7_9PEZI|nr:hypothetical protein VPNG_03063 [Cytospora leucostoma]
MSAPPEGNPHYDPVKEIEPHILAQLDPEFVEFWTNAQRKGAPNKEQFTIEALRANPEKFARPSALDTRGFKGTLEKEVTSEDGAKIPVRVYYPDEAKHGPGPYPVHLNFHGGGFVVGDLTSDAGMNLRLAEAAGIAVVDVGYRHCPETLWGKCFQDAWAALNWARDEAKTLNFKSDSFTAGGISAGGHIVLVLQHLARDAGFPLKAVLPTVPPTTDLFLFKYYTHSPFASFKEFYRGPVLPWAAIKWFGGLTMPEDKVAELKSLWPDWYFSPLRAPNFKGLAPAFIRTGGCDMLRDEGEAYGHKLIAGGNKVTIKRYLGMPHTFARLEGLTQQAQYEVDTIEHLKDVHGIH